MPFPVERTTWSYWKPTEGSRITPLIVVTIPWIALNGAPKMIVAVPRIMIENDPSDIIRRYGWFPCAKLLQYLTRHRRATRIRPKLSEGNRTWWIPRRYGKQYFVYFSLWTVCWADCAAAYIREAG